MPREDDLMAFDRHSFVAFYPSDWIAGTARLPRLHRSAYFDICCAIWDTAKPVPALEVRLMLSDLPDAEQIVTDLIEMGKIEHDPEANTYTNPKALDEAKKAYTRWKAMSDAGKGVKKGASNGAGKGASNGVAIEPEPEPEPEPTSPNGEGQQQAHERVFEVWNRVAEACELSKASTMTDKRKTSLRARLKEFSLDQIVEAIESIETSPFLLGRGERGFKATLDFVLQAKSLPKLIEGDYHGRTGKRSPWLNP